MTITEMKKALYKEKPTAVKVPKEIVKKYDSQYEHFLIYKALIGEDVPIYFKIPMNEAVGEDGEALFKDEMPAQLLIRWLNYVKEWD